MSANEEQSLRELRALLQRAQGWEERIDAGGPAAAQVLPGSALAEDDARTAPYQLSHSAWNALGVAVDHTRCLRWVLNGEEEERGGRITFRQSPHSPGTILRGAIENGARAVWLLAPEFRSTRVARRLSLETYEYAQAKNLWDQLGRIPAGATPGAHRDQLRRLKRAAKLSKADKDTADNFPGYGALVRQAGGEGAIAAWRACSSLAHGATRGANLLTRETVDVVSGVETMYLKSLSIPRLILLTGLAVAIIDRGFTRYQQLAQAAPGPLAARAAPAHDAAAAGAEEVTLVVQVAGKVRDRLLVPAGLDEAAATERALASETAQRALGGGGRRPSRVVYLPDKLINLVP